MNMENARKEIEAKALNVTVAAEYLGWALKQLFPGTNQTDADYITAYQGLHRAYLHALKKPENEGPIFGLGRNPPRNEDTKVPEDDASTFNFAKAFQEVFPGIFTDPSQKAKQDKLIATLETLKTLVEGMREHFGPIVSFNDLPAQFAALVSSQAVFRDRSERLGIHNNTLQDDNRTLQNSRTELQSKVRELGAARNLAQEQNHEKTKCLEQLEQALYEAVGKSHTWASVPSNEERMEVMLGFVHELRKAHEISTAQRKRLGLDGPPPGMQAFAARQQKDQPPEGRTDLDRP